MDTYKNILESNSGNEQKFYDLTELIQEKENVNGLSGLTEIERKLYLLDVFISQLNNGGFHQFFFNTSSEYNNEILSILDELRLSTLSQLLRKGIVIYSSSKEEDDKMDELDYLDDQFYDLVDYKKFFSKVIGMIK